MELQQKAALPNCCQPTLSWIIRHTNQTPELRKYTHHFNVFNKKIDLYNLVEFTDHAHFDEAAGWGPLTRAVPTAEYSAFCSITNFIFKLN